jgi:hypothetical protein
MCDTEVYTIRVDSVGASSNASFVGYMNIPLRNVIKAEILSLSFHGNANTPVTSSGGYYLNIEELKSKFNDRTNIQYGLQVAGNISTEGAASLITANNVGQLATSVLFIPTQEGSITSHRTIFTINDFFPAETPFIEPIRQIEKFTVNIYTAIGNLNNFVGGPTYMTLRITCSKPNVCLYPDRVGLPIM